MTGYPGGWPVSVLTPGNVLNPFSGELEDDPVWAAPIVTPVGVCPAYPTGSGNRRDTPEVGRPWHVADRVTVIVPAGTVVTSRDRIRVGDGPYAGDWDVDGQPEHWRNPFTSWDPGVEVRIVRVAG